MFPLSFLLFFPWCGFIFFGRAWAAGTRGASNEPLHADCGPENRVMCVGRHDLYRSHASMNKQKKKKKKKKHFVSSLFLSLVHISSILGQAWAEGKGEHATSRLERPADVKPGENVRRHDL